MAFYVILVGLDAEAFAQAKLHIRSANRTVLEVGDAARQLIVRIPWSESELEVLKLEHRWMRSVQLGIEVGENEAVIGFGGEEIASRTALADGRSFVTVHGSATSVQGDSESLFTRKVEFRFRPASGDSNRCELLAWRNPPRQIPGQQLGPERDATLLEIAVRLGIALPPTVKVRSAPRVGPEPVRTVRAVSAVPLSALVAAARQQPGVARRPT